MMFFSAMTEILTIAKKFTVVYKVLGDALSMLHIVQ